ncbi:hypothetical protein BH18ACT13_BH18ACT13_12540 [soil metagenome]
MSTCGQGRSGFPSQVSWVRVPSSASPSPSESPCDKGITVPLTVTLHPLESARNRSAQVSTFPQLSRSRRSGCKVRRGRSARPKLIRDRSADPCGAIVLLPSPPRVRVRGSRNRPPPTTSSAFTTCSRRDTSSLCSCSTTQASASESLRHWPGTTWTSRSAAGASRRPSVRPAAGDGFRCRLSCSRPYAGSCRARIVPRDDECSRLRAGQVPHRHRARVPSCRCSDLLPSRPQIPPHQPAT